ncbi:MAG: glycosyltransferase family 2 protein [Gammaproteobacteria bacterium]|nr:glycosyltransferase family 2 protein [Gammaproteobacteria bacterium]
MTTECRAPELSIIVPTFKEVDNVRELVRRVEACMGDVAWEIIFVDDDSPDGTADEARAVGNEDTRVRCIQRIGRRGLSTACVEGMLASNADYFAVMDGDLQHDETLLPEMLRTIKAERLDAVVGSRYVDGGGIGDWNERRAFISRFSTQLGEKLLKVQLKDPMSGFFMITRETLNLSVRNLSGIGFKILLDIFASAERPLRFKELPFTFRTRQAGESKLDSTVAWEYVMMLLDKTVGRYVPVRFISFSLIGGLGVFVHMAVLTLMFEFFGAGFAAGQITATLVAMVFNFFLNNVLTYRDRRLRGIRMLWGLLSFMIACSVGAFANVGIAIYLFEMDTFWVLSAIAGVLVGAVWNYAITTVYTWNKPKGA